MKAELKTFHGGTTKKNRRIADNAGCWLNGWKHFYLFTQSPDAKHTQWIYARSACIWSRWWNRVEMYNLCIQIWVCVSECALNDWYRLYCHGLHLALARHVTRVCSLVFFVDKIKRFVFFLHNNIKWRCACCCDAPAKCTFGSNWMERQLCFFCDEKWLEDVWSMCESIFNLLLLLCRLFLSLSCHSWWHQ